MTVCYDTVLYNICDIFAELNLFVSRAETLSTSTIILPSCISLCFWFPHSSIFMELKAPIKLVKGWKSSQLELLHSAIYPKDFVRLCLCNMIIQSICCPLVSPEGRLWSHIGVADMPNNLHFSHQLIICGMCWRLAPNTKVSQGAIFAAPILPLEEKLHDLSLSSLGLNFWFLLLLFF